MNPESDFNEESTDTAGFRRSSFQPTNPIPIGVFDEVIPAVSEEVVFDETYVPAPSTAPAATPNTSPTATAQPLYVTDPHEEQHSNDADEFLSRDYDAAAAKTAGNRKGKAIGGVALGFAIVGLALSWNILGSLIALVLLIVALILVISAMKKPGGVALRVIALILVFVGILVSLMTVAATWAALAGGLSVKPTSSVIEVGGTPVELSLPGIDIPSKTSIEYTDPAPVAITF